MAKYRQRVGEVRDGILKIRVTDYERQRLKDMAASAGVSVGALLVGLALGDQLGKVLVSDEEGRRDS